LRREGKEQQRIGTLALERTDALVLAPLNTEAHCRMAPSTPAQSADPHTLRSTQRAAPHATIQKNKRICLTDLVFDTTLP